MTRAQILSEVRRLMGKEEQKSLFPPEEQKKIEVLDQKAKEKLKIEELKLKARNKVKPVVDEDGNEVPF